MIGDKIGYLSLSSIIKSSELKMDSPLFEFILEITFSGNWNKLISLIFTIGGIQRILGMTLFSDYHSTKGNNNMNKFCI